ncbi:helix-turn-helix domain-containing protein [Yoonia sp. TsM2_T14_4]|uniref:helix-turn-helix domain-containing protein n=1 Tax=Yoonia sp. TsM2_T14_4 TaxID=3415141 RepID=UPI003C7930D4
MKNSEISGTQLIEQLRHAFHARLRSQILKKNISLSQLARSSGISRSVLSGYMRDDPALPNTANLMRLAQALDCEPGAFFPMTSASEQRNSVSDIVNISLAMVDDNQLKETLSKIAAATGEFIYYVPNTLPDALKTDGIFSFEDHANPKSDNRIYIEKIRLMISPTLNGVILISEETLLDLIHQRGIYAGLSKKVSDQQMNSLVDACHEQFPSWQIKVFSHRDFRVSPCFLIGNSFLVQEFFKYNIQIESVPTILGVQASLNTIHRLATDFLHWMEQNTLPQTDIQKV